MFKSNAIPLILLIEFLYSDISPLIELTYGTNLSKTNRNACTASNVSYRYLHTFVLVICIVMVLTSSFIFAILNNIIWISWDVELNPGPQPDNLDLSSLTDVSSTDTSMDNFLKELFSTHIGILHFNVQSLKPKLDIINVSLFDFDILCFTESWLNEDIPDSNILLDGYNSPFRCDRPDRLGGGVVVYTKCNIVCIYISVEEI